ncbi:uncharacterized protein F4822DRAFT_432215 [Hypoxylon trugodes]|uniref:uncharacterized protein n=1 Tax=Hypoxylon trugodes TaxID=326681 RepID=UPI00219B7A84|nr:uncharacterized protein F4822DRAFT_432215 [Hypoxylon trugodes]KAI1385365.1 hypothetical protein F4822DRAFT_432215 [Hypoxylon trugodes]
MPRSASPKMPNLSKLLMRLRSKLSRKQIKIEVEQPEENETGLAKCPTEMILVIAKFLPEADMICFALTCKGYFTVITGAFGLKLDPNSKEIFLSRMEGVLPGLIYCPFRNILTPIGNRFDKRNGRFTTIRNNPKATGRQEVFINFPSTTFVLNYHKARLITNYQIHSPQHGFPPSCLSYRFPDPGFLNIRYPTVWHQNELQRFRKFTGSQWGPSVCHRESWKARLFNGELYLSATHTRLHSKGDCRSLEDSFASDKFFICMHTRVPGVPTPDRYYGIRVPRIDQRVLNDRTYEIVGAWNRNYGIGIRDVDNQLTKDRGYHASGSCMFCLTDWEITLEWIGSPVGWVYTIKTYHNIGDCRSPFEGKWKAMNTRAKVRGNRFLTPNGAVKNGWLMGVES